MPYRFICIKKILKKNQNESTRKYRMAIALADDSIRFSRRFPFCRLILVISILPVTTASK